MIKTAGDRVEWTFPADPGAVRTARLRVRAQLADWGLDAALGDIAVLLVSELVTNSVRHAVGPIRVSLARPVAPGGGAFSDGDFTGDSTGGFPGDFRGDLGGEVTDHALPGGAREGVLLVEVSDPVPDPPRARKATLRDENGRGLQLVAGASRRWGTRPQGAGKTVWFELPLPG